MPNRAKLTTRGISASTVSTDALPKSASLTNNELDSNFINLRDQTFSIVGDDSSGIDIKAGDTIKFLGAGGATVTATGSTVTVTASGGGGGASLGDLEVTGTTLKPTPTNSNITISSNSTGSVTLSADYINLTGSTGGLQIHGAEIANNETNGNITIVPNGTGNIVLDGLKWPNTDGTANYVLTTDGAGNLSWAPSSAGMTFVGDDSTGTLISNGETIKIAGGSGITTAVSGDTLTITATGGSASLGDFEFSSNNISNKITNGDINITPNGTGNINLVGDTVTIGDTGQIVIQTDNTTLGKLITTTSSTSYLYLSCAGDKNKAILLTAGEIPISTSNFSIAGGTLLFGYDTATGSYNSITGSSIQPRPGTPLSLGYGGYSTIRIGAGDGSTVYSVSPWDILDSDIVVDPRIGSSSTKGNLHLLTDDIRIGSGSLVGANSSANIADKIKISSVNGQSIKIASDTNGFGPSIELRSYLSGGEDFPGSVILRPSTISDSTTELTFVVAEQSIIPNKDLEHDLGSATKRWRSLYLSGSTINLGDAAISAEGTAVLLPSESRVAGNLIVTGNLQVDGTQTILNTETLEVQDNKILLNSNVSGAPTTDAGIEIERGTDTNKSLIWNESTDKWSVGSETFVAGTLEGNLAFSYLTATPSTLSGYGITDAVSSGSKAITIVGDDSSGTNITIGETFKIAGTSNITTAVSGDTLTITGPNLASYLTNSTITIVGDDSTGTTLNTGETLKIAGGGAITTAVSGDTLTISATSSAQGITFVGDDSTGTRISDGESIKIAGGTGISTAMSGDVLTISAVALDDFIVTGTTISAGTTNADITITSSGTGNLNVDMDTLRLGDSNADATITTNGTGDLILSTNATLANSPTITIGDTTAGNISIKPALGATVDTVFDQGRIKLGINDWDTTIFAKSSGAIRNRYLNAGSFSHVGVRTYDLPTATSRHHNAVFGLGTTLAGVTNLGNTNTGYRALQSESHVDLAGISATYAGLDNSLVNYSGQAVGIVAQAYVKNSNATAATHTEATGLLSFNQIGDNSAANFDLGNITVTNAVNYTGYTSVQAAIGRTTTVTNAMGFVHTGTRATGSGTKTITNEYAFRVLDNSQATNKYAFYADNDAYISRLGTQTNQIGRVNALTYGTNITVDCDAGVYHNVTLTGATDFFLTNLSTGQSISLIVKQDATGSRTATFSTATSTAVKFPGGTPTLSTAANAVDIINIFNDGTNYYGTINKAYA